ncbi:MAG: TonB family protein [Gammaproteobacteria bacterium]|nr:TonB family protein [Gammaproteobacteria bacterium]
MLVPKLNMITTRSPAQQDHFGMMLIAATVIHTVLILGISFGGFKVEKENKIIPSMEVTLVNTRSENEPVDADFLAQANQEGGGNTEEKVRPETPFAPLIPDDTVNVTTPSPPLIGAPEQKRATRDEFMTQEKAREEIVADVKEEKKQESKKVSAAQLISQSKKIASLEAELGKNMQAFAKLPRSKYISAATKEYKYATYMESWRRKVEKIGNLNFPEEAKRRNLSGSLILDVAINPDGTINKITIARSSGYKLLDDAAARIVHLAGPYAPLSKEILKDTDILHITRTWKFIGNKLDTAH